MSAIAARSDIFVLLRRFDERPSEWGSPKVRVTSLDGVVVEGLLEGWDDAVVAVRSADRQPAEIAIAGIEKVEAYSANMPVAMTGGAITGLLILAPLFFLSRDNAHTYMYWAGALLVLLSAAGGPFTRLMSKWSWLERLASKWNVLYEARLA